MAQVAGEQFETTRDLEDVIRLLVVWRVAGHLDNLLTPWRLRLLFASRLWDGRNARVWREASGRLVGFAALFQRWPGSEWLGLEWVAHHDVAGGEVAHAQLDWAIARSRQAAGEMGKEVVVSSGATEAEGAQIAMLLRHGFERAGAGYNLYMRCPLDVPLPRLELPAGYAIRSFAGETELHAYIEVYNATSSPVRAEHLRSLQSSPAYNPALDLVATASDGALVAFCNSSFSGEEWARGRERIGWIEHVGTHPDVERRGLGRALTLESMRRLHGFGAQAAMLITRGDNAKARRVYTALGFAPYARHHAYTRRERDR